MDMFVFYVFRRNGSGDLDQIHCTCGSLNGAKCSIAEDVVVERYEEEVGQIYAVVGGKRTYRIAPVRLN